MKKFALVLILAFAIVFVNAQDKTTTTTPTTTKTTGTTTTKTTTTPQTGNTRVAVKITDLPKTIQDDLTKTWAGYTPKNAFKMYKNSVITYRVIVTKDTSQLSLLYDAAGKFLSQKAMVQRVAPKTTTTGTTKQNTVGIKKDSIKK